MSSVRKSVNSLFQTLTRNRLGTTGVGDTDELLQKHFVLVVVPITEDDCEFFIVVMLLLLGVKKQGRTQTINVLTLYKLR